MSKLSLKSYLSKRGIKLKWLAAQIGMEYHAFFSCLKNNYSFDKEVAERLEEFLAGAWKAVPAQREGRFKMELSI
jgi:hypothetical protein